MSATVPGKSAVVPSWTWGSSARLRIDRTTAFGPPPNSVRTVSAQLMQVSLPEPAVCSVYLQAVASSRYPLNDKVQSITLNFNEGIGRVTVPRQITYPLQPAPGAPLEVTLAWVPVHALNVDVTLNVLLQEEEDDSEVEVEIYMILSPLTRIPQKEQQLAFGMALPGEADSLDDDLRDELETEGPTAQQAVLNGRTLDGEGINGQGDDVEGDDDGDDEPELTPLQRVAAALTERLGRRPTRIELQSTVRKLRARAQRRQGR
jgi:hypothetical protein